MTAGSCGNEGSPPTAPLDTTSRREPTYENVQGAWQLQLLRVHSHLENPPGQVEENPAYEAETLEFGPGSRGSFRWRSHSAFTSFAGQYWIDGSYSGMTGIDSVFFFGRGEWSFGPDTHFYNASVTDEWRRFPRIHLSRLCPSRSPLRKTRSH